MSTTDFVDPQEIATRLVEQAWAIYVKPEIERRVSEGRTREGYVPRRVQIVMNADAPAAVRLDDEVHAHLKVKATRPIGPGEPVRHGDIEEIVGMELTEKDPNAAHITLIHHAGSWRLGFDFRYNAERIAATLDIAREFAEAAEDALARGNLRACGDNLFSAVELTAKAWLLRLPRTDLLGGVGHQRIKSDFNNLGGNLKNVQHEYVELFNTLGRGRDKARYRLDPIPLTKESAKDKLDAARRFLASVREQAPKPRGRPAS